MLISAPKFNRPTCRGSLVLGTACGTCERCVWERSLGMDNVDVELPDDTMNHPFPSVVGVGRVEDSTTSMLVSFSRPLTDDEMRDLHEYLKRR